MKILIWIALLIGCAQLPLLEEGNKSVSKREVIVRNLSIEFYKSIELLVESSDANHRHLFFGLMSELICLIKEHGSIDEILSIVMYVRGKLLDEQLFAVIEEMFGLT